VADPGAHAVPPEYRDRPDGREAYVRSVIDDQLPAVAAQGAARFCDVFCEEGAFSADQSRRILEAAGALGLRLRLHADELVPSAWSRSDRGRVGGPPGDAVRGGHRRSGCGRG
jgi:imidazolonepropionase-like amidohydrolase